METKPFFDGRESPAYKEGSEACRNYSRLTMQVRTLSQQVLIGAVIALSVATLGQERVTQGESPVFLGYVLFCAGIVLGCFGTSLALVDWHYQSAFTAIRNVLVQLEGSNLGPWRAHCCVRQPKWRDFISSYFPFWVLWLIGLLSLVGSYGLVTVPLWLQVVAWILLAFGLLAFSYIGFVQGDIDVWKELGPAPEEGG